MAGWPGYQAQAGDLKLSLPQRSKATPVQRLNREGVDAVHRHRYEKAKTLFYRAFLFDPDDPFTLNNLGYISELEGNAENAQRFYNLAAQHTSNAIIDKASSPQVKGKSVQDVLGSTRDFTQINSANREAVELLSKGRAAEANLVLQQALATNPNSAFTLNNIGVAKEMQGELEEAMKYYNDAVNAPQSTEPITITSNKTWRGKPVNEMAANNARRVRERLDAEKRGPARAERLTFRGVAALNRNDQDGARQYFQQAYALGQNYSFSLNNIGYMAELDGDLETAQDFYKKARIADRGDARVGLATRSSVEGMTLSEVAGGNDQQSEARITERHNIRLRENVPIKLKQRTRAPAGPQPTPSPEQSNPK